MSGCVSGAVGVGFMERNDNAANRVYAHLALVMSGEHVSSSQERLRLTVAALLYATGETQRDLGGGIGRGQSEVSRRQSGASAWSLDDLDRLSAHFGIAAGDLLCGADHAVAQLPAHRRTAHLGSPQTVIDTPGPGGPRR